MAGRTARAVSASPALGPARRTRAQEVRDQVLALVAERCLGPGDRLPTEVELSEHFGVGRSTTREALKLLEQDGLVIAEQGRGRFLSPIGSLAVERPVTRYESVSEMLETMGMSVTTTVLSVEESTASPVEAEALALDAGAPVVRTLRLRSHDDEPIMVNINTIPRACLPGPVAYRDWSSSITAALAAHGHYVLSSAARITATELPDAIGTRYGLAGLGAWLLVQERCVTADGRRVLYAEDFHRGSAFAFQVLRHR
ncbi:MAG: GntR family transcriptional regulator [Actinobacteria bacterium]|nr:GntR family transcriptional regulator [Actinomycetota bacterium]